MGFSADILSRANARLASLRADHESLQNARKAQVYRQVPRIGQIDRQMQQNMVRAVYSAFSEGAQDAIEQAKNENKALQAERNQLMQAHFAPDFWNEAPFCPLCGGSGYVGSAMCSCLKALCVEEQRKDLGVIFAGGQSFENFRLDYYSDGVIPGVGYAPRAVMEKTLRSCQAYARSFGPGSGNLMLIGGTGLGKTHLALAIGRTVGEMGYSVCYEPAGSLFTKLEQAKFTANEERLQSARQLETCDLLIIDDLGTEMPGQFTTSALYQLLNARLMGQKPTLITTNLNVEEAGKRYSPQIASRLYGDFTRLTFVGTDIRTMKNRGF